CAVYTAVTGGTPTFFVQSGSCSGDSPAQISSFTGTNPAGAWTPVIAPPGGFGIFAADPNSPTRLMASSLTGPTMRFSTNGGTTWDPMPELDALMDGGGFFRYRALANDGGRNRNTPEVQPTLVAFDPADSNILVAGGRNSGVFISADGGQDWELVTDPIDSGNSGTPHIPRPRFAYFDHEPSNRVNVYVGSEGRGVWRISFLRPPVADAGCPYTTNEGSPIALNGSGTDLDPGPLTLEWDFDNDGIFDDGVGVNPVFNNVVQNGFFPISLRVTDSDGAFDTDGCDVEVLNVPPTVVAGPDQTEFEDEPVDLVGTIYTDPGILDTHTATINWGDGTPVEPGVAVPGAPGSGVVNGTHVYPDPGHYTVTITVTDSDGDSGSDTKTITVVHGFLQYCLFGLGDRPRADRVDVRKGTFGDCRVGANARVRFKRRVELQGGARSYEQKVRAGKDNRLNGDIRAGANGKVKRRSTVTGDVTAETDLVLRRRVTLDGDATAGAAVDTKPSTSISGAVNSDAAVPPSPPITEVSLSLASGGSDIQIGRNETRSLAPGSYGRLETGAGAILELSSGRYRFERFMLLKDSQIRLDLTGGPVIVDVTNRMRIGRRSRMVITSAVGGAEDIFFQKQGPGRVRLKKGGRYLGTFLAPDADLKLGRWSILEGALYGRESNSKVGSELTQRPAIDVFISLFLP
ncbi:MAG: PKD domain-containing protein, partial [Thermoanaerobaculia bacterium]